MTPKLKKIILTILIIGILFVVYSVFIKKDPQSDGLLNSSAKQKSYGDTKLIGNQISQALFKLENIKLDKSIFTNKVYLSLTDRSQPISDEPIGRPNPFAPIGDISFSSSIRSTSTNSTSTNSSNGTSTKNNNVKTNATSTATTTKTSN